MAEDRKMILMCHSCGIRVESDGPEKDIFCPRCNHTRINFIKIPQHVDCNVCITDKGTCCQCLVKDTESPYLNFTSPKSKEGE